MYKFKAGDLVRHCYKDCYGIGIIVRHKQSKCGFGPTYWVHWTKQGPGWYFEFEYLENLLQERNNV